MHKLVNSIYQKLQHEEFFPHPSEPKHTATIKQLSIRRVAILYGKTLYEILISSIIAISIAIIFWQQIPTDILKIWLCLYALLIGLRYYVTYLYFHSSDTHNKASYWYNWQILSMAVSGMLWGALILLLMTQTTELFYLSLASFCTLSLCSIIATIYSVSLRSFFLFSIPLMLPFGIYILFDSSYTLNILGIFTMLLLIIIAQIASKLNYFTNQTLIYEIENRYIASKLQDTEQVIVSINNELEKTVHDKDTEKNRLLDEKQKAEDLAGALMILSIRDGLTGIYNRRYFDESLNKEWFRMARLSGSLSLIMCDIDQFKSYNDFYGHLEGDRCLIAVTKTMKKYVRRAGDILARYGGEEFAIILPNTQAHHAESIAKQICVAIEALAIPHEQSKVKNIITVSMGVSCIFPKKGIFPEILIEQADKMLYDAKKSGGNQALVSN